MNCMLCMSIGNVELLIDITSDEAQRLNVASVLHQHFRFHFQSTPNDGYVCQKCWIKVSDFHEFYNYIESILATGHTGFLNGSGSDAGKGFEWEFKVENMTIDNVAEEEEEEEEDFKVVDHPAVENSVRVKKKLTLKRRAQKAPDQRTRKRVIKCENCGMNFLTFNSLDRHIKQMHNVKTFKCQHPNCVESFDAQEMLDDHFSASHTRTECPHCKKLILVSYIAKHIKERHDVDKNVICDICGKVSPNAYMHASHHQVMHEVQEKVQCAICGDWLKHKDSMRTHMARHVQGPQTCSTCGHVSPNRKALAKHKKTHSADFEERFKCIVCGKGFRDNRRLKEHSYIHSGVTDAYRCVHCGRTFRFGSMMYKHRKQVHPEEEKKRKCKM